MASLVASRLPLWSLARRLHLGEGSLAGQPLERGLPLERLEAHLLLRLVASLMHLRLLLRLVFVLELLCLRLLAPCALALARLLLQQQALCRLP